MEQETGFRIKKPAHPGGFVRSEIIESLGLSITSAALALGVSRQALSALLSERARLSAGMALRLEKAFGVSMETLMKMQLSHEIALIRERADEIRVSPYAVSPGSGHSQSV